MRNKYPPHILRRFVLASLLAICANRCSAAEQIRYDQFLAKAYAGAPATLRTKDGRVMKGHLTNTAYDGVTVRVGRNFSRLAPADITRVRLANGRRLLKAAQTSALALSLPFGLPAELCEEAVGCSLAMGLLFSPVSAGFMAYGAVTAPPLWIAEVLSRLTWRTYDILP